MKNVIVIGAGVAGLIAAVKLAEAGCCVTVLEASDRVGGRIRTEHAGDAAIELGAEFIHGKARNSSLCSRNSASTSTS